MPLLDKFERKISGQGAITAGKGLFQLISNEDIDDTIKVVESIEKSSLLNDGVTETVQRGINKQVGGILGAMMAPITASLIAPMAF